MNFFDYIFYRVCKAYSKSKDSSPEGTAMVVISMMQGLNIISCEFIYEVITQNKNPLSNYVLVGMGVLLMIFNYTRYIYKEDRSYKILSERWVNEPKVLKVKNGILTTLYIIISLCLSIGLAIYLGGKKS